ncbi:MAG TPA: CHY zinc finger protein [Caulobacteraceae bacterium]|nr:CHY zinc finger protein [Caulobacteraceae bacterium]
MIAARPPVFGLDLDSQTRCAHWRGPLDIVALKLRCCGRYYACRECHDALEDHAARVWPRAEWDELAAMCGVCGHEMSAAAYQACDDRCPACGAAFNPGCRLHRHLYFEG